MATVIVDKPVNLYQLNLELGVTCRWRVIGDVEYRTPDVDQAALESALSAHVADFGIVPPKTADELDADDREAKRVAVGQAVPTLRQWADDAAGTNVANGNNNAVTQTMVNRLGVFFDRFADLIEAQYLDR